MSNGVPISSKKMIQSLKEIVNGVPEAEIYATLKDCNMDPNEAVNRLLSQDTFHEVKSKREKKKESKDTTEFRPRGGSSSNRGGRSGTDRYAGRSSSTHYSSSESGGVYGKPAYKRENGASSYTASATPAPRAAPRTTNWNTPTFRGENFLTPLEFLLSLYSLLPTLSQNKVHTTPNPSQQSISHNYVPEYNASPDNDWSSIEPSQPQPAVYTHADWGLNSGQSNLLFDRRNQYDGYETNEAEPQHKSSFEDHIEDHDHDVPVSNEPLYEHDVPVPVPAKPLYDHSSYRTMDSYQVVNHQKLRRKSALAPTDSVEVYFSSLDDDR
ncbi:GBF-interacting protein 1-like protein isoform X1 [Tanacetum coccineum]